MKNSNNLRIVSIIFIMAISFMSLKAIAFTDCNTKQSASGSAENTFLLNDKLPSPRALIPLSLKGSLVRKEKSFKKETKTNLECNTTALCASFDVNTTAEKVSAWMGFNVKDGAEKYFIVTYGQEATYLGNNTYSTPKWDKGHFWIHIGKDVVPFPIQPRFVGVDEESSNEWYVVDYIGYKRPNIDYSNYEDNLSISSLLLLVNPKTKKVEKYHVEYYDENDEYSGDYDIEIGDELQATFLGFKKGEDDVDYLFSIEALTAVTSPITFEYKEQYPGKDFSCTFCAGFDFGNVELLYVFEEFGEQRSTFTEPKPIETKENTADSDSNTSTDLSSSSSKSVPISGFWMFFILLMGTAMLALRNDDILHKN